MSDEYSRQADADREKRLEAADEFDLTFTVEVVVRVQCDHDGLDGAAESAEDDIIKALDAITDTVACAAEWTHTEVA